MEQTSSSFVDAAVPDEVLSWAQSTVKNAVQKNLEEPHQHFRTYGDLLKKLNLFHYSSA